MKEHSAHWRFIRGLTAAVLMIVATGCTTPGFHRVRPTVLEQAATELPESQLLDVGVSITAAPELDESELQKQGTSSDIRRGESNFIPYHLKSTLQASSQWGIVQVVPSEEQIVDLVVTSELIKSNGELMQFKVEARDAAGRRWLSRKYEAKVKAPYYDYTVEAERDAFQDLYNTVANDLSAFKKRLTPEEIEEIRTVSRLRYARDIAPDAYGDYLAANGGEILTVQRLPADDDPLMERIDRIHARDEMFLDTLNLYYEGFYLEMWDAYENWREYYLDEQDALRQAKAEGFLRTLSGILMVAAAIALQTDSVPHTAELSGILILAGGQVVVSGINLSEQVEIHEAAIEELADSFGAEMLPTVVELEGKRYELIGTAAEQYRQWKDLLHQIYVEETGFDVRVVHDEEPIVAPGASSVIP